MRSRAQMLFLFGQFYLKTYKKPTDGKGELKKTHAPTVSNGSSAPIKQE